jgi:hypothetical protein
MCKVMALEYSLARQSVNAALFRIPNVFSLSFSTA